MERSKRKRKLAELKSIAKARQARADLITLHDDDDDFAAADAEASSTIFSQNNNNNKNHRDWSSVTEALLLPILSNLQTLEDFFAFRGVCAHWRSLCSPSPPPAAVLSQRPLLLLASSATAQSLYDPSARRFYRSRLPWDTSSRYALCYSHSKFITTSLGPRPRIILYNLFSTAMTRFPRAPLPFTSAFLTLDSDFHLLVLLDFPNSTLQVCRTDDRRWVVHHLAEPALDLFKDVNPIIFRNKLYVLSKNLHLGVIDLDAEPSVRLLGNAPEHAGSQCTWHLAESRGELLLVAFPWFPEYRECLLWRWDFAGGGWVKIRDLGGQALFIGASGFAGSISPIKDAVRANCIYYAGKGVLVRLVVLSLEDQSEGLEYIGPPCLDGSSVPSPVSWVLPSLSC